MGSILPPSSPPPPSSTATPHEIRQLCRTSSLTVPTPGLCPGAIQANLLVLPSKYASDFLLLCERNPVPCPLLGYTSIPGNPHKLVSVKGLPPLVGCNQKSKASVKHDDSSLEVDFDIRTDVPMYNVYQNGKLIATKPDITAEWTSHSTSSPSSSDKEAESHVAFLIGCSFTFETALLAASLPPRHLVPPQSNVPMYATTLPLAPAGIFTHGTWVVSMRPYHISQIEEVRRITRPYRHMHGEPVAWGWEAVERLGIRDLSRPEWGDKVVVRREEGEVPVFWGCGVTPQNVVMGLKEGIQGMVMAHVPGCMLVLDLDVEGYMKGEGS